MNLKDVINHLLPYDKGISKYSTLTNVPKLPELFIRRSVRSHGTTRISYISSKSELLDHIESAKESRSQVSEIIRSAEKAYNFPDDIWLHPFPASFGATSSVVPYLPMQEDIDSPWGIVAYLQQHSITGRACSILDRAIRGMIVNRSAAVTGLSVTRRLLFILMVINLKKMISADEIKTFSNNLDYESVSWVLLYFYLLKYHPTELESVKHAFLISYSSQHRTSHSTMKDGIAMLDRSFENFVPHYMAIVFKALFTGHFDLLLNSGATADRMQKDIFETANSMTSRFSDGLNFFSPKVSKIIEMVYHRHEQTFEAVFIHGASLYSLYKLGGLIVTSSEEI